MSSSERTTANNGRPLTTAGLFVVVATVAECNASAITIALFVGQVIDDRVDGSGLGLDGRTRRVPTRTAESEFGTTAFG